MSGTPLDEVEQLAKQRKEAGEQHTRKSRLLMWYMWVADKNTNATRYEIARASGLAHQAAYDVLNTGDAYWAMISWLEKREYRHDGASPPDAVYVLPRATRSLGVGMELVGDEPHEETKEDFADRREGWREFLRWAHEQPNWTVTVRDDGYTAKIQVGQTERE